MVNVAATVSVTVAVGGCGFDGVCSSGGGVGFAVCCGVAVFDGVNIVGFFVSLLCLFVWWWLCVGGWLFWWCGCFSWCCYVGCGDYLGVGVV